MNNDACYTCGGEGVWCGVHDSPDGCDCEDTAPRVMCPDCKGTGISNDGDDEDES